MKHSIRRLAAGLCVVLFAPTSATSAEAPTGPAAAVAAADRSDADRELDAAARQRALLDGMRAIARSRDCHPSIQHQWNAAMGDALAAYLAAGGKLEG